MLLKTKCKSFAFTPPNFYSYIVHWAYVFEFTFACMLCVHIFLRYIYIIFCVFFHYVSVYKDAIFSFYYKLYFLVVKQKKKNNEHNAKYPLHMHIAFYSYYFFSSSLKTTTLEVELAQQIKNEKKMGKGERANDRNKEINGREVSRLGAGSQNICKILCKFKSKLEVRL